MLCNLFMDLTEGSRLTRARSELVPGQLILKSTRTPHQLVTYVKSYHTQLVF